MTPSLDYELNKRKIHLELKHDREYCIGRVPDCAVSLGERANVSRHHCVIYFNTNLNSFALADLYSTDGTRLNGRKIGHVDVPLHDGDRIEVGAVNFTFHCDEPPPENDRKTETVKIPVVHQGGPFSPEEPRTENQHFRYRKDDSFVNGEKILEMLSSGPASELYLTSPDSEPAHLLKILHTVPSGSDAGEALRRSAGQVPNLTGVLKIQSCGTLEDGCCYMLSDYLDYPSYEKMISMLSPLPQTGSLSLIYSAALILCRAWQNGIFHGDLKPSNILYAPQEGSYITGMGLSSWRERFLPERTKRPGQWYAAPETTAGKSVWQSDQYALGIMLFQLLTGVLPFRSDSAGELAEMHRNQTMPLPQERNRKVQTVPALDAAILRMTMKEPSERYASWEKLLSDLEKINMMLKHQDKIPHNKN